MISSCSSREANDALLYAMLCVYSLEGFEIFSIVEGFSIGIPIADGQFGPDIRTGFNQCKTRPVRCCQCLL